MLTDALLSCFMTTFSQSNIDFKISGQKFEVDSGASVASVLKKDTPYIALKVGDELKDLETVPVSGVEFEGVTREDEMGLYMLRHSTAHLMAQAVQELYPDVKVTIGPVIEDGFYYDFDIEKSFSDDDLAKIEKRMHKIRKRNVQIVREELDRKSAIEMFTQMGEPYKVEIIEDRPGDVFSIYRQGEWLDLCRGPHIPRTGEIKFFKLLKVAGAYWKGDENNKMLSRIYGTAFFSQEELDQFIELRKEAERRDHRRLGKELDLFSISPEIGPGVVLWHPKGGCVRSIIEDFWRESHRKAGYDLVYSPHVAKTNLWDTSGHTGFYREYMFPNMDLENQSYLVKPMNCPFHVQIYKSKLRSYRELPLRWAELGTVYRYERSGVLHGMMRVRGFTQDDAHIFMTPEQLQDEIQGVIKITMFMLRTFGFEDFQVYLSTRPEKYVGSEENWDLATAELKKALEAASIEYEVDPGEGVFYGPKIDIKIRDSLRRFWQCSTIQVDFNLPERFGLEYVNTDGERQAPIMVHRALLGSLERFFGILVEHYAGAFPLWLAPEQVRVLPLTDQQHAYAKELENKLASAGYRITGDYRAEKLGFKIRNAQQDKIPVMVIVGDNELKANQVSLRFRDGEESNGLSLDDFMALLKKENSRGEM